jgi:serine/threonine-protein kinase RsbW
MVFPGRLTSLAQISDFISETAERADFGNKAIYQMQLAVDEACTNIIEHGYGGEDRGDIDCSVIIGQQDITIILRDRGKPFKMDKIPQPKLNVPLEELQPRGVGVYLMQQMMDEIKYERTTNAENVLTMVKRKP